MNHELPTLIYHTNSMIVWAQAHTTNRMIDNNRPKRPPHTHEHGSTNQSKIKPLMDQSNIDLRSKYRSITFGAWRLAYDWRADGVQSACDRLARDWHATCSHMARAMQSHDNPVEKYEPRKYRYDASTLPSITLVRRKPGQGMGIPYRYSNNK